MLRITKLAPFLFSIFISVTAFGQGLYDQDRINEIEITFKDKNWVELLKAFKADGKDRLEADMTLNGKEYKSVGVRFKGNSSYFNIKNKGLDKLPFNIKADYKIKDQKFDGKYDRIKLSNVFADPSYVREVLAYEIAGAYTFAPKANFVKLRINGEDYGVYTNTQSIDDVFLEEHFEESDGPFFKCDKADKKQSTTAKCGKSYFSSLKYIGGDSSCYFNYYELKSDTGWADFIQMCKTLNLDKENVESVLDIDKTLWMHAFNMVLVNLDSYSGRLCHNYYMYKSEAGQFVPLIWDLNLAFGAFKFSGAGSKLSNDQIKKLSLFTHYKEGNKNFPLITNILSNSLYRRIYLGHVHTILTEYFESGKYYERAKAIHAVVGKEVEEDDKKLYDYSMYEQNLDTTVVIADFGPVLGIKELMEERTSYLMSKPYFQTDKPVVSSLKHEKTADGVLFKAIAEAADELFIMIKSDDASPFITMPMQKTEEGFEYFGPYTSGMKYYCVAVNKKIAKAYPNRASYAPLTVK